jgi:UDP-N-acetylglucosamine 4,6-dehydratase/5-epimerase
MMNRLRMNIFEGKDILVTGGCGSIGSEIVRQLIMHEPKRVRVLDNDETGHWRLGQELASPLLRNLIGDIRDRDRLGRAMEGVDYVFHAAALKHVPLCEYNPYEAVHTNVIGTQNVVDAAISHGVKKLIGISTDKAVNPINTMGATKLLSERLIVNAPVGFSEIQVGCVRFGNVLGSAGSVIPMFRQQIAKGGPLTITTPEMTRFFMTIPQAVDLVLKAAERMVGHEVFVLKMDVARILDIAEIMIDALAPKYGHRPADIAIEYIGKRAGEKTHEFLFTEDEVPNITVLEDMFIIRNSPFDPLRAENENCEGTMRTGMGRLIERAEIEAILTGCGLL